MARARAKPSEAGSPRPKSEGEPTVGFFPHPPYAGSTKRKRCSTPACLLIDFHDGASKVEPEGKRARKPSAKAKKLPEELPAVKTEENARKKPPSPRPRPVRPGQGGDFEVERLLGCRTGEDGSRRFVVRWEGYSASDDSWEEECDIEDSLIRQFDSTPYSRAPWNAAHYLVERVGDMRKHQGKQQAKVAWLGYEWPARWIDVDKLVAPPPLKHIAAAASPSRKARTAMPKDVTSARPRRLPAALTLGAVEARWFGAAQPGPPAARLAAIEEVLLGGHGCGGLQPRLRDVDAELRRGGL